MSKLDMFNYLRGYLRAAVAQCPGDDAGVENCSDPNNAYSQYYQRKFYPKYGHLDSTGVAQEFITAVEAFAYNLSLFDKSSGAGNTLKNALLEAVSTIAPKVVDKISVVGPDLISGTLTEIQAANQTGININKEMISSFSEFEKVVDDLSSRGKISSEDVDLFKEKQNKVSFRNTIDYNNKNAIVSAMSKNNSKDGMLELVKEGLTTAINKIFTDNYTNLNTSSSTQATQVLNALKSGNVNEGDMELFQKFANVIDRNTNQVLSESQYSFIDPAIHRINLMTDNVMTDSTANTMVRILKVFKWLPVLTKEQANTYSNNVYYLRKIADGAYKSNSEPANFPTTPKELPVDIEKLLKEVILRHSTPQAHIADDDFSAQNEALSGTWTRRSDNTFEHKLSNGETAVYRVGDAGFDQNVKEQLQNCQLGFDKPDKCREFLRDVAEGNASSSELINYVNNMTSDVTVETIRELHPKIALAILKSFGFRRRVCKDKVAGRSLEKVQNTKEWLETWVSKKFDSKQVETIKNNTHLLLFLDLLSQLINSNPSVLNDSYVGETEESTGDVEIPEFLVKRKVSPVRSISNNTPKVLKWTDIISNMHKTYGSFTRGLNFANLNNLPFGLDGLTVAAALPTSVNVVGSTHGGVMSGGSGEPKTAILNRGTRIQYSNDVAQILGRLIGNLKGFGKILSKEDTQKLDKKMQEFSQLEKQLYDTANKIQLYAQLLKIVDTDHRSETVSENHIKQFINTYQHLLGRYEKSGNTLQTLISLINECTDGKSCVNDGEL
jgi:hypothetical protein